MLCRVLQVFFRMSSCGGVVHWKVHACAGQVRRVVERLAAHQPHCPSLSRALIHGWLSFAHGNPLESSRSQLGLKDAEPLSLLRSYRRRWGFYGVSKPAPPINHQVPLTQGAPGIEHCQGGASLLPLLLMIKRKSPRLHPCTHAPHHHNLLCL